MNEFLGEDLEFDLESIIDPEEQSAAPTEDEKKEEKTETGKEKSVKNENIIEVDNDGNEIADKTTNEIEEEGDNEKTEESTDDGSTESSSSNIADYASALYEEGAFPDITKEELDKVKTVEDLVDLNIKQIKSNELRDLSPEQKEALAAFRNGFSLQEFKQMKSEEIQYDAITDDQLNEEEVASKIVSDYLKLNNTDESVINDLLESYKVDEKLKEKAKQYLPKIKGAIEKRNQDIVKSREEQRENAIKEIQTGLDSTKEVFKGIALTENDKKDLFNQMTHPVKILDNGQEVDAVMAKRMEDPVGFMVKLHYYAKLGLFDKEPSTEFLETKAKTKALSKLEEKLSKGNSSSRVTGSRKTSDSDMFDFDDIPDVKLKY